MRGALISCEREEIINGVFSPDPECTIKVTDETITIDRSCMTFVVVNPEIVTTTNPNLPEVTDRDSLKNIDRLTEVIVKSDPTEDVDVLFNLFNKIWIKTKKGLLVQIYPKRTLTAADKTFYENTKQQIIFRGILKNKGSVEITEAVIISPLNN